jgi:hypothetical protein
MVKVSWQGAGLALGKQASVKSKMYSVVAKKLRPLASFASH